MPKTIKADGKTYIVPDDATDDEINQIVGPAPEKATAPAEQPSAISRFGSSFARGLGIVSPEEGRNFFAHPIDTIKGMGKAQSDLGGRAYDEFKKGDIVRGATHGIEYLLPGIGPTLAHAGDQLESGDIAGGTGTTFGAAVPVVLASPEVRSATGAAGSAVVRGAAKGTNAVLSKAPGSIGMMAGGAIGKATGIPGGTEIGAGVGYGLGRELLPKIRVPGETFGLPKKYPDVAPVKVAPPPAELPAAFNKLPPTPPGSVGNPFQGRPFPADARPAVPTAQLPEAFQPRPVRPVGTVDAPFQGRPFPGSEGEPPAPPAPALGPTRTLPGQIPPERIAPPTRAIAAPIPARSGLALPSAPRGAELADLPPVRVPPPRPLSDALGDKPTVSVAPPKPSGPPLTPRRFVNRVAPQLDQSLGAPAEPTAPPLKPGVPLRMQGSNPAPEVQPVQLPEGHTAVDSSALKSYKYDPAAREFHAQYKSGDGTTHVFGDVSPQDAQTFEQASSKGKAMQNIKHRGQLVAKIINGKRVTVKPVSIASPNP